jgi:hypothetical protein
VRSATAAGPDVTRAIASGSGSRPERARANTADRQALRARIRVIEARLAIPAGGREGHARGYAT